MLERLDINKRSIQIDYNAVNYLHGLVIADIRHALETTLGELDEHAKEDIEVSMELRNLDVQFTSDGTIIITNGEVEHEESERWREFRTGRRCLGRRLVRR
jgi:hypothetical protein